MESQTNRIDETFYRAHFETSIHSNSILYYFAESPFFDQASKNALITNQGLNNQEMGAFLRERHLFEAKIKERPGLEFVVAQEPAETGPGVGTGVWVINKQHRDEQDRVTVLATYFVVGESIYMAPSLADVLGSRMAAISSGVGKILPTADSMRVWTPSQGRRNQRAPESTTSKTKAAGSRDVTPMAQGLGSKGASTSSKAAGGHDESSAASRNRVLDEAMTIHQLYGHEYMDENPITGKPGAFHFNASGRPKENKPAVASITIKPVAAPSSTGLPKFNITPAGAENATFKTAKETKSPKTPSIPKPKRRKSKVGGTTPS